MKNTRNAKRIPGPRFYRRDPAVVARDLLGCELCRRLPSGRVVRTRIVETEAYYGDGEDAASHSFRGPTPRNQSMFLEGGHFYVYFIYGMYFCLNVVTSRAGEGNAVLIRALENLDDPDDRSMSGPGKLCRALKIDRSFDGRTCDDRELWIEKNPSWLKSLRSGRTAISVSKRVGLNPKLGDSFHRALRFHL